MKIGSIKGIRRLFDASSAMRFQITVLSVAPMVKQLLLELFSFSLEVQELLYTVWIYPQVCTRFTTLCHNYALMLSTKKLDYVTCAT